MLVIHYMVELDWMCALRSLHLFSLLLAMHDKAAGVHDQVRLWLAAPSLVCV